jgi:nucleoside-diphosphate-sugar epimerase
VRGVDVKMPEFDLSAADEFQLLDVRHGAGASCGRSCRPRTIDEIYQLAAEMGGMGFISTAECEIMRHSALMNLNLPQAAVDSGVSRYFLSSSVCIYRDMVVGDPELTEDGAYPAQPDSEYGWEKLFAERVLQAYGRRHGLTVRLARFQNCYGPEGTWTRTREGAGGHLSEGRASRRRRRRGGVGRRQRGPFLHLCRRPRGRSRPSDAVRSGPPCEHWQPRLRQGAAAGRHGHRDQQETAARPVRSYRLHQGPEPGTSSRMR